MCLSDLSLQWVQFSKGPSAVLWCLIASGPYLLWSSDWARRDTWNSSGHLWLEDFFLHLPKFLRELGKRGGVAATDDLGTSTSMMQVTQQWRWSILPQSCTHVRSSMQKGWTSVGAGGTALHHQDEPEDQRQGVGAAGMSGTLHQLSKHRRGCFPFSLSKLHTDSSCHPHPKPHRKGDSAKCSPHLAKVPQNKPPLLILFIVSAEKLLQCFSWGVYTWLLIFWQKRGDRRGF